MPEIKHVGVLGCGLMGSGIAQVAASAGYSTTVREVSSNLLDKGKAGIVKSLDKFVEKGKLSQADRDVTLKRLDFTTELSSLRSCDIVIEAVTEDLELKNGLWKELDGMCPSHPSMAWGLRSGASPGRGKRLLRISAFAAEKGRFHAP